MEQKRSAANPDALKPAAPATCEYCDALWERNPATMLHRHPEGTAFSLPCKLAAQPPTGWTLLQDLVDACDDADSLADVVEAREAARAALAMQFKAAPAEERE